MPTDFLFNTYHLVLDAAPWLLLGLIVAGLIKAWIPETAMRRWLGGQGSGAVARAAVVGAPLPLCSCGVLPAALGLRRAGASKGATVSFLIATPETGVDSVAVSYALLGPFMTVVRPVAAIVSAIATGLLTALVPESRAIAPAAAPACCGGSCAGNTPEQRVRPSTWARTAEGMRFGLKDVYDDILPWLVVGLLFAAAVATWVPPQALQAWGSGLPAMLVMLVVGIPMYICATASTPVAAGLLLAGISPGTVLVFLLAGPATNIGTIGVLRREMGNAVVAAYLAGIAVTSIALGLLTDQLVARLGIDMSAQLAESAGVVPEWLAVASALVLAALALRRLGRHLPGPSTWKRA